MKDLVEKFSDGKMRAFLSLPAPPIYIWFGKTCWCFESVEELISVRNILTQVIDYLEGLP